MESDQLKRIEKIRKYKSVKMNKKSSVKKCLNAKKFYSIALDSEKGASCWVNTMQLEKNFNLSKSYRDGNAIRYGWEPQCLRLTALVASDSQLLKPCTAVEVGIPTCDITTLVTLSPICFRNFF